MNCGEWLTHPLCLKFTNSDIRIIIIKSTVATANNRHELVFLQCLLWWVESENKVSLYRRETRNSSDINSVVYFAVFGLTESPSLTPLMLCYVLFLHFASKPAGMQKRLWDLVLSLYRPNSDTQRSVCSPLTRKQKARPHHRLESGPPQRGPSSRDSSGSLGKGVKWEGRGYLFPPLAFRVNVTWRYTLF